MLKRLITGMCYSGVIAGFLLLRGLVDSRLFQILVFIFCAMGTFELARALKDYLYKGWYYVAIVFGILFVPHFAVVEFFVFEGYGWLFSLCFSALFIIATGIAGLINKGGFKKFIVNSSFAVYPALLLLTMSLSSTFEDYKGIIALLLIFILPALSDTLAYLVGMTYQKIRKGQAKKLCPKLSPKKTVAGAIGGIFGGILAVLIAFFIYKGKFDISIWIYVVIGVVASILTEIGDLFESYIKRKVGIKDMGKIMPGHGGVMDRIDGMSFAGVFIFLMFKLFV